MEGEEKELENEVGLCFPSRSARGESTVDSLDLG